MKKVLVIDDSFEHLVAAEEQLGQNYNLTTVQTFAEARELIPEGNFDVVMTDVMMSGERSAASDRPRQEESICRDRSLGILQNRPVCCRQLTRK